MQTYITSDDYLQLYAEVPDDFDRLAYKASRIVDTLTHNRIIGIGFENLTDYQQQTIIECCCEVVKFYYDNADVLDGALGAYSINGVSMQFSFNSSVAVIDGCTVSKSTYNRLITTGLCCGVIR